MTTSRIIALVDMDCFYVQVEQRDDPSIKGKPAAVVQYKNWKGGGIIAVNYEARALGVSRNMRGDDAKAACSEIILVRVPETRGKADLTKYRDAGREVINVLSDFSPTVERASIDEAYIDLTEIVDSKLNSSPDSDLFSDPQNLISTLNMEYLETNFVMDYESTDMWLEAIKSSEIIAIDQLRLLLGAEIVGHMRKAVYDKTGFRCSAGIAHNKVLAKLACGINKPNKQTVIPHEKVQSLWSKTSVKKVRNLGGKLGDYLTETLGCKNMIDLLKFTEKELSSSLGSKTANWLYQLVRGYDDELVTPRQLAKSIGCNKNFFGPEALVTKEKTKFWLNQLSAEVVERIQKDLEMNNRKAKVLTLHIKFENQNAISRSCGVPHYNCERMAAEAYSVVEKLYHTLGVLPINVLGLIASKFEDELDVINYGKIDKYFPLVPSLPPPEPVAKKMSNNNTTKLKSIFKPDATVEEKIPPIESKASSITNSAGIVNIIDVSSEEEHIKNASSHSNETEIPVEEISPNKKSFFTFKAVDVSQKRDLKPHFSDIKIQIKSPAKIDAPAVTTSSDPSPGSSSSVCERCGKTFYIWDLVSHMDYHFAKDLQRELNGLPALPAADVQTSTIKIKKSGSPKKRIRGGEGSHSSRGAKRGRGAKSASNSKNIKTKTLDSYFTPKS